MVDDTISKRCSTDLAAFGFVDNEMGIVAGGIRLCTQCIMQIKQMVGDVMLEGRGGCFTTLTLCGFVMCPQQIGP